MADEGVEKPAAEQIDWTNLPAELKGKSIKEILDYYQNRDTEYQRALERVSREQAAPAAAPAPAPSTDSFWEDPLGAVKKVTVSREEFNAAADAVQRQMVKTAEFLAKSKHSDWDKWAPQINQIMNTYPANLKADEVQWETAYTYVKGLAYDRLEATRRAEGGAEAPSVAPAPAPKPEELSEEQRYVVNRMGLTKEKYFKAREGLATGNWPLTFDTRKGAK